MFKAIRSQSLIELNKMLRSLWDKGPAYKVYTALLNQTETNIPTAIVLQNTLDGEIVWSRQGVGLYYGTLAGAFLLEKTGTFINKPVGSNIYIGLVEDNDNVFIRSRDISNQNSDQELYYTFIEIRVYP